MLAATAGGFFLIRQWGEQLTAPPGVDGAASSSSGKSDMLLHVLIALAAMVVAGRLLGRACKHIGQPPVIGEVLAGICLGPSLLGQLAPAAAAFLLPAEVAPALATVAQLGVILYMFVVGLELDTDQLRHYGRSVVAISHASIIAPFLLGALLALFLYPRLSEQHVPFTAFALFLGVSMSITAFPVLARILTDRQLARTGLGAMALACAATDDATAWCLLAFVVGVAQAKIGGALVVVLVTLAYIAAMLLLVRPLAVLLARSYDAGPITPGVIAFVLVGVLLSAIATEAIGIHAIFGAFLLGAMIPHDSRVARELGAKLSDVVTVLFLPAFFALTGMRTQIGLVAGAEQWLICGLIIAVATLGKFGGTLAAARLSGIGWRDSAAIGVLMNTRGLMELIVLNIGLELGVISPTLFAMMVLMALATTIATSPLLSLILGRDPRELSRDEIEPDALTNQSS